MRRGHTPSHGARAGSPGSNLNVTDATINFMSKFGRGLICLSLTEERADYLRLSPMVQQVFRLTHVNRIFQIFESEEEAVATA